MKAKYIKTESGQIIIFPLLIEHSSFKNWTPVSAGFIAFGVDKNGTANCSCFGESVSLQLKSEEGDSLKAQIQIIGLC